MQKPPAAMPGFLMKIPSNTSIVRSADFIKRIRMAQKLSVATSDTQIDTILTKALQSGHLNFLLGSGASMPAIAVAGSIEADLDKALEEKKNTKFESKKLDFLSNLQSVTNDLIDETPSNDAKITLSYYKNFLLVISEILNERKMDLLPKQASIFTTNYDLFIERASETLNNIRLNDGFLRNPSVATNYVFQPEHYFDVTFKTGTLFQYRFPVPTINLIKLHGSLSWQQIDRELSYRVTTRDLPDVFSDENEVEEFNNSFSLILPTKMKFHETLLTRVYYDLLRIFANTLEVENTALICFGFSFSDEHILDIVKRGLKNPTLLLLIISYDESSAAEYEEKFDAYNNVIIIHPEGREFIDFANLNATLKRVVPKHGP